jgi:hypothetical protein
MNRALKHGQKKHAHEGGTGAPLRCLQLKTPCKLMTNH